VVVRSDGWIELPKGVTTTLSGFDVVAEMPFSVSPPSRSPSNDHSEEGSSTPPKRRTTEKRLSKKERLALERAALKGTVNPNPNRTVISTVNPNPNGFAGAGVKQVTPWASTDSLGAAVGAPLLVWDPHQGVFVAEDAPEETTPTPAAAAYLTGKTASTAKPTRLRSPSTAANSPYQSQKPDWDPWKAT